MKTQFVMALMLVFFLFFSLSKISAAETFSSVEIYRIAPSQAFIGQKIWVALVFENIADTSKDIALNESLASGADFNQSGAQYTQTAYGEKIWYYEWRITLEPKANTSVAYWLMPKAAGTYVISPARVTINGQSFRLKSHAIEVRCNANAICESGENYLNCPEDCNTGEADDICDAATDGKCDPDCEAANDADCQTPAQDQKNQSAPEEKKSGDYLTGTLMLIIPAVIFAVLAAFYLMKRKGKK